MVRASSRGPASTNPVTAPWERVSSPPAIASPQPDVRVRDAAAVLRPRPPPVVEGRRDDALVPDWLLLRVGDAVFLADVRFAVDFFAVDFFAADFFAAADLAAVEVPAVDLAAVLPAPAVRFSAAVVAPLPPVPLVPPPLRAPPVRPVPAAFVAAFVPAVFVAVALAVVFRAGVRADFGPVSYTHL